MVSKIPTLTSAPTTPRDWLTTVAVPVCVGLFVLIDSVWVRVLLAILALIGFASHCHVKELQAGQGWLKVLWK